MNLLCTVSIAACLVAAMATLGLILPGEYCQLATAGESFYVVVIIGPYFLLALMAWCHRGDQRISGTLLLLNVLLALGGLGFFAAETSDYRTTVSDFVMRDPDRGAEYIQARFQRTALFVVPALQWFVTLIAAGALFVQGTWASNHVSRNGHPPTSPGDNL